jgi:hypothetical protein
MLTSQRQEGSIMMKNSARRILVVLSSIHALVFLMPNPARAHCDTMNGPVVIAAQKALETSNVNLVLIWVRRDDEATIREAFAQTLAVRKLSPEARTLADMYFFETVVRIHRAGEGVAYTGLKPADTQMEPGIVAADHALAKGTVAELMRHLDEAVQHGIQEKFSAAMAKKNYGKDNVEAGREYVKAYVTFIHYAEGLSRAASAAEEGHLHPKAKVDVHDHEQ